MLSKNMWSIGYQSLLVNQIPSCTLSAGTEKCNWLKENMASCLRPGRIGPTFDSKLFSLVFMLAYFRLGGGVEEGSTECQIKIAALALQLFFFFHDLSFFKQRPRIEQDGCSLIVRTSSYRENSWLHLFLGGSSAYNNSCTTHRNSTHCHSSIEIHWMGSSCICFIFCLTKIFP